MSVDGDRIWRKATGRQYEGSRYKGPHCHTINQRVAASFLIRTDFRYFNNNDISISPRFCLNIFHRFILYYSGPTWCLKLLSQIKEEL
jgi:hypothetical protein